MGAKLMVALLPFLLATTALCSFNPIQNSALAISSPSLGDVLSTGRDYTITWTTSPVIPEVDLILRSGNQADLTNEFVIAKQIPSTGSYVWHIPDSMRTATGLSIMIHDSRDPMIANYSPYFTILAVPGSALGPPRPSSVGAGTNTDPSKADSSVHGPFPGPTETIRVHISEKHPHRILDGAHGESPASNTASSPSNPISSLKSQSPHDNLINPENLSPAKALLVVKESTSSLSSASDPSAPATPLLPHPSFNAANLADKLYLSPNILFALLAIL